MVTKPLYTNPFRQKSGSDILQNIVSEISIATLTKNIGLPIDEARIRFAIDPIIIDEMGEFNLTIFAFYAHTQKHLGRLKNPADFDILHADAFALLNRAFVEIGGLNAAIYESRTGVNGGMKFILDRMTDQYKSEEFQKRVTAVLKTFFDPLEFDIRVALVKDLLELLKPNLPVEIGRQPPEKFSNHYEILVKSYVNSMDQLNQTFQSF